MASDRELWVFGYGSLIWRPDFQHVDSAVAVAHGWVRRFYQGSIDHRGVPGAPGRVVTLLPRPGQVCAGMAFRVDVAAESELVERLDRREVGGYDRLELEVVLRDRGASVRALTYVATTDNPNYLGHAPVSALAAQVLSATGPSGPNVEYVLELADALEAMGEPDPHVAQLARRVRALLG